MAYEYPVLIVDDTPEIVRLLEAHLATFGFQTRTAGTGDKALQLLADGFEGPVLLDLKLPDYEDLDLFHVIQREYTNVPIIIITAHGSVDMAWQATVEGAFDFLNKDESLLERAYLSTKNAVEKLTLRRQLRELSDDLRVQRPFGNIVSTSPAMEPVFEMMQHASGSRVTVLVSGESGTGKELVARALHDEGSLRDKPFVAVNCAGIPEALLESELFGHEKGAFTGAVARKIGKFELAEGNTLFLDEVGELPLMLQPKLLRVIQEREIERVGGSRPIPLDVRIICATNRDLQTEVREKRFRQDLYYRLAVLPIHVPPLRDRPGDILILAHHFLKHFSVEESKEIDGVEPNVLKMLTQHDFPGNVREVQNIMRHAAVVCSGPKVALGDLPTSFLESFRVTSMPNSRSFPGWGPWVDSIVREERDIPKMGDVEALLIQRALDVCNGNLVQACRRLGVSRATMYRRIEKLGLRRV